MNNILYCEEMCKCEKCGDVFKIISNKFTECKEGCCSVRCDEYGTTYDLSDGKRYCFTTISGTKTKTYNPSYYIKPNEEISELISKIKDEVDLYLYQSFDKDTSGTKHLEYITIEFESELNMWSEQNKFSAYINFTRKDDSNSEDIIINKLIKVLNMFNKSQNGDIDISTGNRKKLKDMFDWERESTKRYNYTFHILLED